MPRTKDEVKKFIAVLEEAGYETRAYSGRAMYGEECVSVWDIARALWFNNFEDEEDLDVPEPRTDSLGLGIVIYWPQYPWPKDGA